MDMSRQPNGEPVYDNVELKRYPVKLDELREYIQHKSEDGGFKKEYNIIPWGLKFSHDTAKLKENTFKNRYNNIIACQFYSSLGYSIGIELERDYRPNRQP